MPSKGKQIQGVGIVGAGRVSRDHAYAVENTSGLHLVGVADPMEEKSTAFGQKHRCEAYTDHRELLARDDLDLVLVGVPHGMHASVTVDVLNAGKHAMIEKPMAMTLDECEAMIEAADKNEVQLMVGHTQHFFPANLAVKRLIDEGAIGELVLANQFWYKPFGLAGRPPWMLDRTQGGGMWLMNGAHMVDCLLWFIGSEVVSVKGSVTNTIIEQKADDSILAFLEFASGVCATLAHSGSKRPEPSPPEQWMTTEITGTEGSLKVISYEGKAWLNTQGEYEPVTIDRDLDRERAIAAFVNTEAGKPEDAPIAQSTIEQVAGIMDEVRAFVGAIEAGVEPPVGNRHSAAVMEAVFAVEGSSRAGHEVKLV